MGDGGNDLFRETITIVCKLLDRGRKENIRSTWC